MPEGDHTRLYFPGDQHQMRAVVRRVFGDPGLRFVYSTRSPVPDVLAADGKPMFAGDYRFEPGKDELIREGTAGYVVSYGEMLFRALDAVEQLREQGLDVGLVNKTDAHVIDEAMLTRVGKTPFVLLVESNRNTGLGVRYGPGCSRAAWLPATTTSHHALGSGRSLGTDALPAWIPETSCGARAKSPSTSRDRPGARPTVRASRFERSQNSPFSRPIALTARGSIA